MWFSILNKCSMKISVVTKTVTVRYIFAPVAGYISAMFSSLDPGFELIKTAFIVGHRHGMSTIACVLACLL